MFKRNGRSQNRVSIALRLSAVVLLALSVVALSSLEGASAKTTVKSAKAIAAPMLPPPPPPAGTIEYDFDNDGKADVGRWNSANYEFKVREADSGSYLTYTLGSSSSAKPAPGDFNGDGATEAGVFLSGTWTYKTSPGGSALTMTLPSPYTFQTGDIPIAGNFDTDSTTDVGVFRPSNGSGM